MVEISDFVDSLKDQFSAVHVHVKAWAKSAGVSHRDVAIAAMGVGVGIFVVSTTNCLLKGACSKGGNSSSSSSSSSSNNNNTTSSSTPLSPVSDVLKTKVRSTASSGSVPGGGSSVYESSRAVDEYLHFHYALGRELVPFACAPRDALNFAARCGLVCASSLAGGSPRLRALDVGCAVGGATMELAKHFKEAIGVDFSRAFVDCANDLKKNGRREYSVVLEGEIQEQLVAYMPADVDPTRVSFMQGDACDLPASLGQFDAVLAANLLCRLPRPHTFLLRLATLVRPGGVAVLISPYSWLEEYTSKDNWVGGFIARDGRPVESAAEVRRLMEMDFDLVSQQDMPFLIREHRRKYQWGCSHCTVWRRRSDNNNGAAKKDKVYAF